MSKLRLQVSEMTKDLDMSTDSGSSRQPSGGAGAGLAAAAAAAISSVARDYEEMRDAPSRRKTGDQGLAALPPAVRLTPAPPLLAPPSPPFFPPSGSSTDDSAHARSISPLAVLKPPAARSRPYWPPAPQSTARPPCQTCSASLCTARSTPPATSWLVQKTPGPRGRAALKPFLLGTGSGRHLAAHSPSPPRWPHLLS